MMGGGIVLSHSFRIRDGAPVDYIKHAFQHADREVGVQLLKALKETGMPAVVEVKVQEQPTPSEYWDRIVHFDTEVRVTITLQPVRYHDVVVARLVEYEHTPRRRRPDAVHVPARLKASRFRRWLDKLVRRIP